MIERPVHDPGRGEAVATMKALLERPSHLPIVLAGPDADSLLSTAYGRPLVSVHVRDLGDRDVMSEAALITALEDRPVIFEGLEDIEPADRARLLRAIEQRPGAHRAGRADAHRRARAGRADRAARRGRLALLRRARPGLGRPHRHAGDRRRRGEVPALDDPDRRGRRGRAAVAPPPAARRRRRRSTWTSARARRPPRGSASSPPGSRRASAGRTWSSRTARRSCCTRSRAYLRHRDRVLSATGATRRPSRAPRA